MNAIETKGLCKAYSRFMLDDVSFALPQGCIMGLIGENGAGKSTTIKLILNIIKKDAGEISVMGKTEAADMTEVKQDIGVVLDDSVFPPLFTAKNINSIMKNTYTRWNEQAFYNLLSRFDVPANQKIKDFSKGTKMKLSIAVALSHEAKLLILDEPTNGLDPVVRDEIVDMFGEFTRNPSNSILISSHIVSDLEKVCDYIAFIHKGRLILCEEKDRLLEQYCIVRCTAEELEAVDRAAVRGKKESPYGVEAIVERGAVPQGMQAGPIGIEDLFIFMVKEAQ